jgi:hypothetical protein
MAEPKIKQNQIKQLSNAQDYRLWAVRVTTKLKEIKKWDKSEEVPINSEESNNFIIGVISDNLLEQVLDLELNCTTLWSHFRDLFLVHSISAQSTAITSLINFNYSEANMLANKNTLLSLARDLRTAFQDSENINLKHLLTLFALVNIPEEYQSLRTTLEETNKEGIEFDDLFESLIREEAAQVGKAKRMARANAVSGSPSQCPHKRTSSTCWSCHPSLRPVCVPCQTNGVAKFNHSQGSRFCESKQTTVSSVSKAAAVQSK